MKRNHIIFAMAALSFAVSACENNRDNALPGATACFLAEGVLESAPFYVVDAVSYTHLTLPTTVLV